MSVEQRNIDAMATTRKRLAAARKEVEKARCDLTDSWVDAIQREFDLLSDSIKRTEYIEQAVMNGEDEHVAFQRWSAEVKVTR